MSKVYYTIKINSDHPKGERLEYHMGRDRHNLEFSRGLMLEGKYAATAQYVAHWVREIQEEAHTYNMIPIS